MHNLVVSFLAVAYLSANVYAIVKMRVFELARSRKHLLLYGVPFILWGSLILGFEGDGLAGRAIR